MLTINYYVSFILCTVCQNQMSFIRQDIRQDFGVIRLILILIFSNNEMISVSVIYFYPSSRLSLTSFPQGEKGQIIQRPGGGGT